MCMNCELFAAEGACTSFEDEVESVLSVHSKTAQFGAVHVIGLGYSACLAAIAVQGETS